MAGASQSRTRERPQFLGPHAGRGLGNARRTTHGCARIVT
jgi:hypothetical protein